ncbi:hypothetical protein EJ04DRAFT_96328 [Polyplosphaeria fusca]|uniref:Uncharacterized protein n=1 Tax=Polyplosphaeria fusca TaxID=682080 RepID=A0A9P4QPD4_9PLEO|nr:hypothetical protein EJ04DRAFT_96328 [Polyplosphaeria fusca]
MRIPSGHAHVPGRNLFCPSSRPFLCACLTPTLATLAMLEVAHLADARFYCRSPRTTVRCRFWKGYAILSMKAHPRRPRNMATAIYLYNLCDAVF